MTYGIRSIDVFQPYVFSCICFKQHFSAYARSVSVFDLSAISIVEFKKDRIEKYKNTNAKHFLFS